MIGVREISRGGKAIGNTEWQVKQGLYPLDSYDIVVLPTLETKWLVLLLWKLEYSEEDSPYSIDNPVRKTIIPQNH